MVLVKSYHSERSEESLFPDNDQGEDFELACYNCIEMKSKYKILIFISIVIGLIVLFVLLTQSGNLAILNPKGVIAVKQKELMITALSLMLIAVVPAFVMLFWFLWKYRAGNKSADYQPNWEGSKKLAALWWAIP